MSYNCHSLLCENCYHSVVVSSITITAATGKVHVQPQAPVNNSLYTVNSQTQQLILHVLALLRKEKLGKKTKKSGEKTITEDACVSLWYLILTFDCPTQTKNISLLHTIFSYPSLLCALPSRLLKMRPTTTIITTEISNAMGRIDGWMSCIWFKTWCKTRQTGSLSCVFRY